MEIYTSSDADESIFFSTEADGGIYISMNNYLKWCAAIESGKFSRYTDDPVCLAGHRPVSTRHAGLWYGCGWFIHQLTESSPKVIYHTGFNGGFRTVVFMIPALDYCISIFSNRSDIDLEESGLQHQQYSLPYPIILLSNPDRLNLLFIVGLFLRHAKRPARFRPHSKRT